MHQLITEDAVVVAKVITVEAVTGTVAGAFVRCFPPRPKSTMNVMTLGIHATLSYLRMLRLVLGWTAEKSG